ncbi:DUF1080 domain-containing protein [Parasegetibacter sp. NRK P23]|uniref:3-keto-disaccharide hydrolase n=1 Tax=Parasegetibacter sp. NRK P23 TaxID=2942999 RepID=UPI0020444F32|nr:DUF1080 domain-containing protein [Parasegetibacter sp. NRK P23]MCM5529861.1 DUF1080 domain-containing protein [Parasegetibacter sp. NRK P23]
MKRIASITCLALAFSAAQAQTDPKATEVWQDVKLVTPGKGTAAPSDAIVLFGGNALDQWSAKAGGPAQWTVNADGSFTVAPGKGDIQTKQAFGDCQLHVEWKSPAVVKGEGQGRGNSGIFLMGLYEVQVLDSYNNKTYANGQATSIYKQHIPLANATLPPTEWQVYDIFFTAPRFSASGTLEKPAYVTVVHNGILVQNHVEIKGETVYIGKPAYKAHGNAPIALQDHGNPVSFRNIWIRNL